MEYLERPVQINRFGYPTIRIKGKNWYVHVHFWESIHGRKPKGYDIHHKDKNKLNWSLTNLVLVESTLHRLTHSRENAGWKMTDGEWTHKPCCMCKELKLLSEFYLYKTGYSGQCKPCATIKGRNWRLANPERYREISRKRMRLVRKKQRLKKKEAELFFS